MQTLQETKSVDTGALKKFAQGARRQLRDQVGAQLDKVLKSDSAELREKDAAIKELKSQIAMSSREAVIERVAYIWFNRFCALRFMDVNRYTRIGIVSAAEGYTQPEILAEAKQAHIDETLKPFVDQKRVFDLLDGRIISKDPQQEAYRHLIVAACNYYSAIMPFLFQRIADYTELLMPEDLISDSSILASTRETLTASACKDVEVIGWLYQFYISEKKDEVFDDLKKNKKIGPENIPAATQLFTPHWIVRYLVENSLGRLWMLNRPASTLIKRMNYYIQPSEEQTGFVRINDPTEIKVCDPACGSGHMLVYAFDLLYAIYEEEGYEPTEIPRLILQNNLYGIEIDERAGELAAFALAIKARERYRRFFSSPVQPNICILENISTDDSEITNYLANVGNTDVPPGFIKQTLNKFGECKNFGSLIRTLAPHGTLHQELLKRDDISSDLLLHQTHKRVLQAIKFAEYLSPRYHVVVANPPYMGSGNMNKRLWDFVQENYKESKSDLMACFMEAGLDLLLDDGYLGMINQQSWMFLDYFKSLRCRIVTGFQIESLLHLGPRTFPEISGEVVQSVAFVLKKSKPLTKTVFCRLTDFDSTEKKREAFLSGINRYIASQLRHEKIPDSPLGYWFSDNAFTLFDKYPKLAQYADVRAGLQTGNNDAFIRNWSEISFEKFSSAKNDGPQAAGIKWYPYNKGGTFRKWFGNRELVVDWEDDGANIKRDKLERLETGLIVASNSKPKNTQYYFRKGITWSTTGGKVASFRIMPEGELFDIKGSSLFPHDAGNIEFLLGQLNSHVIRSIIGVLTPTLDFNPGYIAKIPTIIDPPTKGEIINRVEELVRIAKTDWDSYETSWQFSMLPLLQPEYKQPTIEETYQRVRRRWQEMTQRMKQLEEENNATFITAYGLQDELTADVSLGEITLNCNPRYLYGKDRTPEELETLFLLDTIRDFISYAVGCMFGRYSLDKPGLILCSELQTREYYLREIEKPSFEIDQDNVIPIIDGDWFIDDICERFRKFLRVSFGAKHYEENLKFIEQALGKDVRKYFLKDFYSDHIRRYKKRPIYWLFSSPKGTFNALIYMHRYRPDTVSVVLNDYLREFRSKLAARKHHLESLTVSASASAGEKTKAVKEIETLKKAIDELDTYERDVLYPLAAQKIHIDLDEGVKTNYSKFGKALKPVSGMAAEED
jgi:type II restriction/modification system DNA methylase subunit YeeA